MKYWYAVLMDNEDNDWGYGSFDLHEVEAKVAAFKEQGFVDAFIAVIDETTSNPVCVEEIR